MCIFYSPGINFLLEDYIKFGNVGLSFRHANIHKYFSLKDRTSQSFNVTGEVLTIHNVTKEAAGLYTCTASNVAGSSHNNITLKVLTGVYKFVKSNECFHFCFVAKNIFVRYD